MQRHAELIAQDHIVSLLNIEQSYDFDQKLAIEESGSGNLYETKVYLKKSKGFFGKIRNQYWYFKTILWHYKSAKATFGKPDLVHVHVCWKMGQAAILLKRIYGIKYVITEHWSGLTRAGWQLNTPVLLKGVKQIFRKADGVTAVSNHMANAIKDLGYRKEITITSNYIHWPKIAPMKWGNGKFNFIHMSSYRDEMKNVSGMLRAFAKALETNPNIHLHLCGDGNIRQEILSEAFKNEKLKEATTYYGRIEYEDIVEFIGRSDALLSFSNFETFAVTVAEALCQGLPVVCTRCGGPEEYVTIELGIVVNPKDEEGFTSAILNLAGPDNGFNSEEILKKSRAIFDHQKLLDNFNSSFKLALGEN